MSPYQLGGPLAIPGHHGLAMTGTGVMFLIGVGLALAYLGALALWAGRGRP